MNNDDYDLIYFGQIRTFKKNIVSHRDIIKNAKNIIISTWTDQIIPNEIYMLNKNVHVTYTDFESEFFTKIDSTKIPDCVMNHSFGFQHHRAMLPKHYLLKKGASIYREKVRKPAKFVVLIRPDLYFYDTEAYKNLFNSGFVTNTKDSSEEVSDQFLIGERKIILTVCDAFDYLMNDWEQLIKEKQPIPLFINEGYLRWKLKNLNVEIIREKKFFEINRKYLHLYTFIFTFLPNSKCKNKFIGFIKKTGLWRQF